MYLVYIFRRYFILNEYLLTKDFYVKVMHKNDYDTDDNVNDNSNSKVSNNNSNKNKDNKKSGNKKIYI